MALSLTQTCAGRPALACSISAARPSSRRGLIMCGEMASFSSALGADVAGDVVEDLGGVAAQRLVAGEEREVGVDAGGARVVVAGAEVGVGDELARLAPHHGRDLGVGLPVDEAVDHLRAGALQAARLADVGGLVEAGLELDERGHRLARLRRLAERGDDRAVARGAVERLLDRQHVGVERGLVQEAHHDVEGLVGVVQQHVLLADGGEDVALEVLHPLGHARGEGRPEEVGAAGAGELGEVGHADQAGDLDDLAGADAERLHDGGGGGRRARRRSW